MGPDARGPGFFFARAVADLGWDSEDLAPLHVLGRTGLVSRLRASELATDAVAVASMALQRERQRLGGARRDAPVRVDAARVGAAFTSERHFRLDGRPVDPWSPLSGFWATTDGWVRTHGNYPHHARALAAALELPVGATPVQLRGAVADLSAHEVEERAHGVGALAVVVGTPARTPSRAEPGARSWVRVSRLTSAVVPRPLRSRPAGRLPLTGVRILDLTRVIAGPVASRTLAFAGAQVLRVDPPTLPEIPMAHLDTGAGKRSVVLDARDPDQRARLEELIRDADAVLLGYAAPGLARLGLDASSVAERHPGIVVGSLGAWEADGPRAGRRGFDSLVQAATGIAVVEGSERAPATLPAQALDHASGYLLAAGMVTALGHRRELGGTWSVHLTLERTAQLLLDAGLATEAAHQPPPAPAVETHRLSSGQVLTIASPAVAFDGAPARFEPPSPYGGAEAVWLP